MTMCELTDMTASEQKTAEEKLLILKKIRAELMEELHCKQQLVDQVDYLIYTVRTGKTVKREEETV